MRIPLASTLASALVATCLLAGCAVGPTPEQRRAADQQTCLGYGFQPGTESFANCMMQTAQRRQDAAQRHLNAQQTQQLQIEYIRSLSVRRNGDRRYPVCSATTPGARLDVPNHAWFGPNCRER